jgi:hypothetical protein
MIVLTSFRKAKNYNGQKFSIARFQPAGFAFPELTFLAATDKNGEKLLLRDFANPIEGYERALAEGYAARWDKIQAWLDSLQPDKSIVLCCWCPYSQSTKDQIRDFGTFCCHSGIIGQLVNKYRPDISVVLDSDRKYKLVERWKPNYLEDGIGE